MHGALRVSRWTSASWCPWQQMASCPRKRACVDAGMASKAPVASAQHVSAPAGGGVTQ
eukprot:CAMPEP_0171084300 /NCGR_PEP_ID=MMETSP0766_2-20121228/18230_1 /TAXON_ID=439317 /ORGANISM="Gambierdiscus australes, Strain CAWD 149" /LENGTH=57 /DNA_ID=CAMNT_0011541791 /DNA_START=487 /DNA_END=660 /DNA_ORIENTATION=-